MARPEKVAKVEDIRQRFLAHQVIFFTDFSGLGVEEISRLRSRLREKGAEYRVLKNTLTLLAIKGTEYEVLKDTIVGPVAAVFTHGDPMEVARELIAYARKNPNLKIKGGYMEGKALEAAEVRSIATLPSREILLARLAGALQGPIYLLHGALSGPYRKLAYALRAVAESRSEAA